MSQQLQQQPHHRLTSNTISTVKIAAGVAAGVSLLCFILRLPTTRRIRPALDVSESLGVENGSDDPTGLRSHQRNAGVRERWYLSFPEGHKRIWTQAITVRGRMPTRFQ